MLGWVVRRSYWLLFGGILLAVGIALLAIGVSEAVEETSFAEEGRLTEGMVVAKAIRHATADEGTEYRVTYRFIADDGRTMERTQGVSFAQWEELIELGPVIVEYVPRQPATSRIAGRDGWVDVWIPLALGGVIGTVGGVATVRGLQAVALKRRLRRQGMAVEGRVVSVDRTNVSFNREYLWKIRYEYVDFAGTRHTGQSGYLSRDEAEGWQAGDIGPVRYDARHPERNVWLA